MKLRLALLFGILLFTVLLADNTGFELRIEPQFAISPMPEFRLEDINVNSKTYGKLLSPSDYKGKVVLVYFGSVG